MREAVRRRLDESAATVNGVADVCFYLALYSARLCKKDVVTEFLRRHRGRQYPSKLELKAGLERVLRAGVIARHGRYWFRSTIYREIP